MKLSITIFIISLYQLSCAQLSDCKGSFHFKTSLGRIDSASYQNFSIGGEYIFENRFGLNYNFDFIHRNDRIYQLHSSAGLLAGPPLIGIGIIAAVSKTSGNSDIGALGILGGILLLVLPEGVSYHIPIKFNWDFAPFLNVLGVDFVRNNNVNKGYLKYTASAGMKFSYWNPKNFTLFSFIETRKTSGMGFAFGGGFGVGKTFE